MEAQCLALFQKHCGAKQIRLTKTIYVIGLCVVLLIEDGNRLILIDNGIGNKQDAKFYSHYFLNGNDTLENSLKTAGFSSDDITDMFLTIYILIIAAEV